ncbi:MAG: hypothetical protein QME81_18675, partial [bacterium]|nr:hypothetical protein [bacterium]
MNCPVAAWNETSPTIIPDSTPEEILKTSVDFVEINTVVMTQACDLEQGKVQYVILCPHYNITPQHLRCPRECYDCG